jgi:hypothetical protein
MLQEHETDTPQRKTNRPSTQGQDHPNLTRGSKNLGKSPSRSVELNI